METISRAIIVAAGEGRRMRPLTEQIPKPLVKVNGTRLIDTSISALKQNGIHEIYIVAGYKKEEFEKAYADDSEITIVENPYYLQGNNITSMYMAREYLPGSFVIEGDLQIRNAAVYQPVIERSGYCAIWMQEAPEWALKLDNGRIISCKIAGESDAYRLWGISMWTREDGKRLADLIEEQFEKKDWSLYWDEIALIRDKELFNLGIRNVSSQDLAEIDTLEELAAIDPSYQSYIELKKTSKSA